MLKNDLSEEMTKALTNHVWKCYACGRHFKTERETRKHENDTHFAETMAVNKQVVNELSEIETDGIHDIEDELNVSDGKELPTPRFRRNGETLTKVTDEWKTEKRKNIKKHSEWEKTKSRREDALRILGSMCVWPKCGEPFLQREIDHVKNDGSDDRKGKSLHEKVIEMSDNGINVLDHYQILCRGHNFRKMIVNRQRQKLQRLPLEKIDKNTRWFEGEK